jgi:hypothetical protein
MDVVGGGRETNIFKFLYHTLSKVHFKVFLACEWHVKNIIWSGVSERARRPGLRWPGHSFRGEAASMVLIFSVKKTDSRSLE